MIVRMDVNENIYRNIITKELVDAEGLNMVEAMGNFIDQQIGAAFFGGKAPKYGVRVSVNVIVTQYVYDSYRLQWWRSQCVCT